MENKHAINIPAISFSAFCSILPIMENGRKAQNLKSVHPIEKASTTNACVSKVLILKLILDAKRSSFGIRFLDPASATTLSLILCYEIQQFKYFWLYRKAMSFLQYTFFYKQSSFGPRFKNCLNFSKNLPPKLFSNCLLDDLLTSIVQISNILNGAIVHYRDT